MLDAGIGVETTRRTLVMLQGMLERAVEWGRIPRNPARYVRKPRQGRRRAVEAWSPLAVEKLRKCLLDQGQRRDATLVALLAYAGLRPEEALALRWGDVRERTIVVDKAVALGEEKATKSRRMRSVRLLPPLAADLAEWRLASGRPPDSSLVFRTREGSVWSEFDWRNWRRRRFRTTATAVGLAGRPYDLRHSFASLLFAEQTNPAEVAEQLGHSPQVLDTYLHIIEELRGVGSITADDQIRTACASVSATTDVAQKLPTLVEEATSDDREKEESPVLQGDFGKPTRGFEPRTPSLRVKCSTS